MVGRDGTRGSLTTLVFAGLIGGVLTTPAAAEDNLPHLDPHVVPPENEQIRGAENADLAVMLAPFSAEGENRSTAPNDGSVALMPLDRHQAAGLYHRGLSLQAAIGGALRDADGSAAGKVTAVLVGDGEPIALLARKGGFLGFGGREFVVPLSAIVIEDSTADSLRLAVSGAQLALLPEYD
ncbi:PRC-barrel domain-containing protein [Aquibaculum arenosum]|uniref:PRC-barrel domain-containing protein n=1 Tax=Aquibaculum arenosum TaxID=3032591 RepID=A0ABT5YHN8_9PROT|nr:PRC-barrel domain-containing protein [Fodinicurvata sp. CAU 1616]MDF2094456.1 PRC-barrel domain-containing protein [Fodinicurvata sp. CAU 1616]